MLRRLKSLFKRDAEGSGIYYYQPYKKQKRFHDAGLESQERLLLAGNQVGKSFAAASEVAMHVTGIYPKWWSGRRFDRACTWWATTNTDEMCNQNLKRLLFQRSVRASLEGFGDGKRLVLRSLIPKNFILKVLKNEFQIRHKGGGISSLHFKSYKQGGEAWQGATLDGVWFDEEPPIEIYMEGLARIHKLNGMTMVTMTPLRGKTELVKLFLKD